MIKIRHILLGAILVIVGCKEKPNKRESKLNDSQEQVIPVIGLDRAALSGIGLNSVKNNSQPDRRLFQKRLVRGDDLSVYIVSSETATAQQEDYAMEEFISLINGRSRMNPERGEEVIFETGDSFIAPKGFSGEWETIGGDEFLIELSIISTDRVDLPSVHKESSTLPVLLNDKWRSGDLDLGSNIGDHSVELYRGVELTIEMHSYAPRLLEVVEPMDEQVVEVVSGMVEITPLGGESMRFYTGDYYMLPTGFKGKFDMKGHGSFRTMNVLKSK